MATDTACLKTHQRWERQLATIGIFADPFTDRFFRPFGVEEVVSDLEGEPKGFAISLQGPCLLGRRTGCQTTEPEACEKQSACLAAVNAFEPGKVCGGGVGLCGTVLGGLFRGKVFRLAADKSLCPCCCRLRRAKMSARRATQPSCVVVVLLISNPIKNIKKEKNVPFHDNETKTEKDGRK